MIRKMHNLSVVLVLVSALSLLLLFSSASAQTEADFGISASTSETDLVEEGVTVSTDFDDHPYRLENLLGEKVFNDFVLGPGKIELSIEPGQSKTVELNVTNRFDETKLFSFEVEDMSGSKDPSRSVVLLGDDKGPYSIRDYISIPQEKFNLEANKRAVIPVTVSVPADAEPGGHYGSVLVKTVTVKGSGQNDVDTRPVSAIVSRIGTLFFVTVPGEVEKGGELINFSTINDQKWFEKGPIDFQILYQNTGSIHLNPYGEIRVTNMFGDEVGYDVIEPWYALPQSTRLREISWTREFLYGRYVATLEINRGYDNIVDEMSFAFWVIPWKLALAIFAGLFVFFWLIKFLFSSFEFKRKSR